MLMQAQPWVPVLACMVIHRTRQVDGYGELMGLGIPVRAISSRGGLRCGVFDVSEKEVSGE